MAFVPPSVDHAFQEPAYPSRAGRLRLGAVGLLHLNGEPVGTVTVTGWDTSWGFGRFHPGPTFGRFATAFGLWSLLMHAQGDRLTRDALDELALAEHQIDRIRARIHFPADDAWIDTVELNIDGDLVEWKEY